MFTRILKNPAYRAWTGMMVRCYSQSWLTKYPTYIGCTVTEAWHTFETFAIWYYEQPHAGEKGFALDKDILLIDNREYSPKACVWLPRQINNLIIKPNAQRKASGLPTGVTAIGSGYRGRYKTYGSNNSLPTRKTPEEAREDYLQAKKAHVRYMVTESPYAALLAPEVVSALLSWDKY